MQGASRIGTFYLDLPKVRSMAPDVVIYYVPGCNLEQVSPICLTKFIPSMTCLAQVSRIGLGGPCPKMVRTNLELSRVETVHGVLARSTGATTRAKELKGFVDGRVIAAGRDGPANQEVEFLSEQQGAPKMGN